MTVDGIPIRASSTHDDLHGDVITAVRLLNGGLLTVQVTQGIPAYHNGGLNPPDSSAAQHNGSHTIDGGWPALPMTTARLTALAATRALLP